MQQYKVAADVAVIGVAAVGWLGLIQPWLTAIATVLAISWTSYQWYAVLKKKKNEKVQD